MLQEKFYYVFNNISEGFLVINKDFTLEFINKTACEFLNLKKESAESKHLWKVVDVDFAKLFHNEIDNVIKNQLQNSFEKFDSLCNRWLKFDIYPSHGGASVFFKDISKEKANYLFFEKSKELNTAILNSIKSNIAIINSKGVILHTNDFWNEFALNNHVANLDKVSVGANYIAITEKIVKKSRDIYAVKAIKGIYSVINNLTDDFYLEYPCHSLNEQRWYIMKVTRVKNEADKFLISHTDISSLKKTELDLLKNKTKLIEAQRIAKVCNWEYNYRANNDTFPYSDYFFDLFELDKDTYEYTIDKFITAIIDDDYIDYFNSERQIANETFKNTTIQYKTKPLNGKVKYILNTIEFELDKHGNPIRKFGILQDITERRLIEQKLIAKNSELKKVNNELDLFVYNTSHDLRAPLKSILGLSSIIKEELDKGDIEQLKRIEMIEGTINKLDNFIEDILHYARNSR